MKTDEAKEQASNDPIADLIWDSLGKSKLYASHWDWANRAVKERGIVCDLLESIEVNGEHHGVVSVRTNKSDPPDCVGTKTNGELIAFEVSELVDQQVVEHNELVAQKSAKQKKRGERKWTASEVLEKFEGLRQNREHLVSRWWEPNELVEKVRDILKEKDAKDFHGGPYAKVVLVIHTAEPHLCFMDCGTILRNQNFGPCKQVTEVYLLFADKTGRESYPFVRLELAELVSPADTR